MTSRRFTIPALCAVLGILALSLSSASAALTHNLLSSFGAFGSVQGVSIDQSSGAVYVLDASTGTIEKFDAAGAPVNFSALSSNTIEGVGGGGTPENELAVDNSAGPAHGDIYVVSSSRVAVYAASGAPLGELNGAVEAEVPGAPWGFACGVTVDPTGNVIVGIYPGNVSKYTPVANPVTNTDYTESMAGVNGPCNVAADSEGNVYAASYFGGVTRYSALQFGSPSAEGTLIDPAGTTLAVDPSTDDLYVDEGERVAQYSSAGSDSPGTLLGVAPGVGGESISFSAGVAVNATSGNVYVSDNGHGRIDILGPAVTIPDVTVTAASNLTTSTATLNGTVNPDGLPANCEFEYAPVTGGSSGTAPCASSPGSGSSPVEVSANVSGLQPNTTYRLKLIATNANGANLASSEFTTLSPPLVDQESGTNVAYTSTTLNANVNPKGFATTFHFEYGLDTSYGTSTPVPDRGLGAANTDVLASVSLAGLQAGHTYHYRIVATNANGTTNGPDKTFTTFATPVATSDECPNAQLRDTQQATYLSDCRAYEMVSPPEKLGGNVAADGSMTQATPNGDKIKFTSTTAFGDAQASESRGVEYLSQRGAEGWTTHGINPKLAAPPNAIFKSSEYVGLSEDLTKGVYFALTPVLPGHLNVETVANLYLRNDVLAGPPGDYELVSDSDFPLPPRKSESQTIETAFDAASSDWSHILFETAAVLTEEAVGTNPSLPKVYEWHNGSVRLAGILPSGEPSEGSTGGLGSGIGSFPGNWTQHTISSDGSRVVFEGGPSGGPAEGKMNVYMRIDGAETVQLNASERSEPDPNGPQPAKYWAATADDSRVFFTSSEALTDDATPGTSNYYMYEVGAPAGHRLTLLAAPKEPTLGPAINGISADGSYVYFTSSRLQPGDPNSNDVYVWHNGTVRFVVPRDSVGVASGGEGGWGEEGRYYGQVLRVTPDGRTISFLSPSAAVARMAGYEYPAGPLVGGPQQVYVYKYDSDSITCASCSRGGTLPEGHNAGYGAELLTDGLDAFGSANLAVSTYLDHPLTDDGRYVFFDTPAALVPDDTNGRRDVYEYDTTTDRAHLISSGACACESVFVEASADGRDVFFVTHQSLVRADVDDNGDLYDARIDGGFAAQNQAPPAPCEGDDCQGPAAGAPLATIPSSATFVGVGNAHPATRAAVKKRSLTRAQKLVKALKACKKKPRKRRAKCEAQARKKYKTKASVKRASHRAGR
jgi:hypothetical protein